MGEWFAMDGYGPYVWSAYGLSLLILLLLLWQSWRLARNRERQLEELRGRLRGQGGAPAKRLWPVRTGPAAGGGAPGGEGG